VNLLLHAEVKLWFCGSN